jgi:L-asparaginase II
MANPVLVEVTRGKVVESRHRGAAVVMDADGRVLYAIGDVERPVFPRSAIKGLQALPLVESGAADRFGFGNAELALAMSSHTAEERHVRTARAMLAAAGLDEGCLECGPQWPEKEADRIALIRGGLRPGRIHNNCSGKHTGFLCAAVALGMDPKGYVRPDHPVMREVVAALESMTGARHDVDACGIDGCSIPTYAIPLKALAHGFARFATGNGLPPERAKAVARLRAAAMAEPFMVDGTGQFTTRSMEILGDRAFVKTGAEGVYIAALPRLGVSLALKIDDGAARASEVAMAALLAALLRIDPTDPAMAGFETLLRPSVRSRNGEIAGEIRPVADWLHGLDKLQTFTSGEG